MEMPSEEAKDEIFSSILSVSYDFIYLKIGIVKLNLYICK